MRISSVLFFLFFLTIIFLEVTFVALPLTLIFLLLFAVILKKEWIFLFGLMAGLLLDLYSFSPLGGRCLFFLSFLFLIFLYEQKYELKSLWFVFFMSLIGAICYLFIFGYVNFLLQIIVSVTLTQVCFIFFLLTQKKRYEIV